MSLRKGQIARDVVEHGLGRVRTDRLVIWRWPRRREPCAEWCARRMVIECKLLHRSLEGTIGDGLSRTRAYLARCGAGEGHLLAFDRNSDRSWQEELFRREQVTSGTPDTVWGM